MNLNQVGEKDEQRMTFVLQNGKIYLGILMMYVSQYHLIRNEGLLLSKVFSEFRKKVIHLGTHKKFLGQPTYMCSTHIYPPKPQKIII